MLISTSLEPFDKMENIKTILEELKKAGFDAYDYSMFEYCKNTNVILKENYKQEAYKIREIADRIGIVCNQSHAPFPTWLKGKDDFNNKQFNEIIKALEVTGILGGKVCVIHPCNDATPEENAVFYNKLLPYAKKFNVKIGVENMWNWKDDHASDAACSHHDNFVRHMELLDKEYFVANLDIGHAEMFGLNTSSIEMIYELKDRLEALHIHDNNLHHDNHAIPFTMKVDFKKICEALKNINYPGDITLEVDACANTPKELMPSVMKFLADISNLLRDYVLK